VAAFFMGCVFMNALQHMASSLFFRDVLRRLCRIFIRRVDAKQDNPGLPTVHVEKPAAPGQESDALREYNDYTALIFTLNLCFMLAGLAQFISLLAYADAKVWDTACGRSNVVSV
jgi:hypothetical protein